MSHRTETRVPRALLWATAVVLAGIGGVSYFSGEQSTPEVGVDEVDRTAHAVDPAGTPAGTAHVNDVLHQWSTGQEDEAVRAFLRLGQMPPTDASYRLFDLSERQFVALPEVERDQLQQRMLAKFKVVRAFARDLDRRANEALASDDLPMAEKLLLSMKRLGKANTGPEVAHLTNLVGKAIQKLADQGLTRLDKARASGKRQ